MGESATAEKKKGETIEGRRFHPSYTKTKKEGG